MSTDMQARYGAALQVDSLWNRWFRRQRLHAHAPELEVAPARSWDAFKFRVTARPSLSGVMAEFAIWNLKAVLCHTDLFESSYLDSNPASIYLGGSGPT